MAVDDSFSKPGVIPFKWEIRPGVPKINHQKQTPSSVNHHRSFVHQEKHQQEEKQQYEEKQKCEDVKPSYPSTRQNLRPPPPGFEFRTHSVSPAAKARSSAWLSERHRLGRSIFFRTEIVSQSCSLTPMLWRKALKKGNQKSKLEVESKPVDHETLRHIENDHLYQPSGFRNSPSSSSSASFSSYQTSPVSKFGK